MSKVSVIIPAGPGEPYINETIKSVVTNASGDVEIILVIDGWKPDYRLTRRKCVKKIYHKERQGMRPSVNEGVKAATGEYIVKIDAHVALGPGWDDILTADCPDNCIAVPARKHLDAETWEPRQDRQETITAMSYRYPRIKPYKPRLTGRPDPGRQARQKDDITEDMTFQGSFWLMHRKHFTERLEGMQVEGYGTFDEEPQDIGLRTQLGPWQGKVIRNANTWFAHWAKPGWKWKELHEVNQLDKISAWVFDYWWHNRWPDASLTFQALVDKFWPLHKWPENWRYDMEMYNRYKLEELWQ